MSLFTVRSLGRLFMLRRSWPLSLTAGVALVVGALLAVVGRADDIPVQPKYGTKATRLFHAREYLRTNDAPDFWALMPYYIHQFNDRACSVASSMMIVNGMRAQVDLGSEDELITQQRLLNNVAHPRWKEAITEGGEGVTIESLGGYLREALEKFGPKQYEVIAVRITPGDDGLRERVKQMLIENEKSDDDFVVVFFWQAEFTDDPKGETGHVAPVAAYDTEHEQVLIFDPDRDWYEPYWVPLDTLVAGMAKVDPDTHMPRGYIWAKTKGK
ncbi:MAG: hypothetical protein JSS27_17910 [Planctomycetes bacterium]|nr:hypothetical protein [Planctomycetota bacterium]